MSFGAVSPLGSVQAGALPELGKANKPGVNLVLPWEARGTRVENRREEAKQPAADLKSIPCHTPFLVGGKLSQDSSHGEISNKGRLLACILPTKREQEGREMVWVPAHLGKNKSRVSPETSPVWRCGGWVGVGACC